MGWLVFDDQHVDQVHEFLKDKAAGSIDQLGFRRLQLSFSNQLCPGVSTQHTRLRYLYFIPWAYQLAAERYREGLSASSEQDESFQAHLDRVEYQLIEQLKGEGDPRTGIIGVSKGKQTKNKAGSLYWSALDKWGVRKADINRRDFVRAVEQFASRSQAASPAAGEDPLEYDTTAADARAMANPWHKNLRKAPDAFLVQHENLPFSLSSEERDYLQEYVATSKTFEYSMVRYLLHECQKEEALEAIQHDNIWGFSEQCSSELRERLERARKFAEITYTADFAYAYYATLEAGRDSLDASQIEPYIKRVPDYDIDDILHEHDAREETYDFLKVWQGLLSRPGNSALDEPEVREAIVERERDMKQKKARLTHPELLEKKDSYSASIQSFRWPTLTQFAQDFWGVES